MAYNGISDAQRRAHRKYMQGMATIQLRLTEMHRDRIKARAAELGESVNAYVLRLGDEDIDRARSARAKPEREQDTGKTVKLEE